MLLKVIYFASARDISGTRSEELSVNTGTTVKALVSRLQRMHPGLRNFQESTRYAVNRELVDGNQKLRDGDVVGVLPAVTGG